MLRPGWSGGGGRRILTVFDFSGTTAGDGAMGFHHSRKELRTAAKRRRKKKKHENRSTKKYKVK